MISSLCSFPLWPSYTDGSKTLISAKSARIAERGNLLVSWMFEADSFIQPTFVSGHAAVLPKLGVPTLSTYDLLRTHILPKLPLTLSSQTKPTFLKFIASLQSNGYTHNGISQLLAQHKIAVDGNETLQLSSNLYDHENRIFQAAFRDSATEKFLAPELQGYRTLYCALGLRQRQHGSDTGYIKCLKTIRARLRAVTSDVVPLILRQDVIKVLEPLTSFNRVHLNTNKWTTIRSLEVFIIKKDFNDQPRYRRARMTTLATDRAASLGSVILIKYAPICWSVNSFVIVEPTAFTLRQVHHYAKPTVATVFTHLAYLVSLAGEVVINEIPAFLKDLHACYDFLQENLLEAKQASNIVQDQPFWFNVDSEAGLEDLIDGWLPIKHLLLQSSCDAVPLRTVRPSLMRYEKLLRELGCQAVFHPTVEATQVVEHSMTAVLRRMRQNGNFLDATLEVDGDEIQAHKLVLSAASPYCNNLFSGDWAEKDCIKLDADIVTYAAVKLIVDAAYEEPLDWSSTSLKEEQDIADDDHKLRLLLDIHRAADYFLMVSLSTQVEKRILDAGKRLIRLDNVEEILPETTRAHATKVEQLCKDFCEQNRVALNNRHSQLDFP